jgi:hypothetical protein
MVVLCCDVRFISCAGVIFIAAVIAAAPAAAAPAPAAVIITA